MLNLALGGHLFSPFSGQCIEFYQSGDSVNVALDTLLVDQNVVAAVVPTRCQEVDGLWL